MTSVRTVYSGRQSVEHRANKRGSRSVYAKRCRAVTVHNGVQQRQSVKVRDIQTWESVVSVRFNTDWWLLTVVPRCTAGMPSVHHCKSALTSVNWQKGHNCRWSNRCTKGLPGSGPRTFCNIRAPGTGGARDVRTEWSIGYTIPTVYGRYVPVRARSLGGPTVPAPVRTAFPRYDVPRRCACRSVRFRRL